MRVSDYAFADDESAAYADRLGASFDASLRERRKIINGGMAEDGDPAVTGILAAEKRAQEIATLDELLEGRERCLEIIEKMQAEGRADLVARGRGVLKQIDARLEALD